ncbi:TetR/AcrR family transcriptional regulator [Sanguibacter sp. 25GB23B1]|uniref:TetR/AcrR family transcriptional regulator n=1 Tax=unclassified Sanguibacter TaxID=2645534 RepID=UPI0032AF7FC0
MPSGDTTTRRRSAHERRDELMDAAIVVMSERGVAAATTRAIADQAGVPQGVFHYCFRSKDELIAALFEREITKTSTSTGDALRSFTDVRSGVRAALDAQMTLVRAAPDYYLALAELSLTALRTPDLAPLAVWEQEQYRVRARESLAAWSNDHALTWTVALDDVASYVVALGAGVASTWLADRDDARADAAITVAAQSLSSLCST